tara:strand:+ start:50 stop:451 length:402 start_codon:yes stop_codon:yes gene_type:complete
MSKKEKKADSIVYTEKDGYNSKLLPYGSSTSAPAIKLEDISFWKGESVNKVNQQFSTKFSELKEEYQKLVETYKWNDLVYKASFSFTPVVGNEYYLYYDSKGDIFLSLIKPSEWNKEHIGAFTLNSERVWLKK